MLANLLLDGLDKELERRGHWFCRYADDCNIYVRSKRAGERVMQSITRFLENKLRLRVNAAKSAVAHVQERKFLGYRLLPAGVLGISPASLKRVKERIRQITRRNRSVSMETVIYELNGYLTGWVTYFRYAQCRTHLKQLDEWLRRKLRCYRLKQRKRAKPIADFLMEQGVPEWRSWLLSLSGKGWWRMAGSPQTHEALPILNRLMNQDHCGVRALILAPTRELAEQIHQAIETLGLRTRLKSATAYGGKAIGPQIQQAKRADILVACPGRLLDHIGRRSIDLSQLEVLVIDEADRMFDMGFLPDINKILTQLPQKRQTLLFSATMPTDFDYKATASILGVKPRLHQKTKYAFSEKNKKVSRLNHSVHAQR